MNAPEATDAAELTRDGRRKEFAHFKAFATPEMRASIPDPCDEQTFRASKLDWKTIDSSPASLKFRALTAQLLRIRREKIVPLIENGFVSAERSLLGKTPLTEGIDVRWKTVDGGRLQIVANFGENDLTMPSLIEGETLWRLHAPDHEALPPGDLLVRVGSSS